jgi:hypothetical protein
VQTVVKPNTTKIVTEGHQPQVATTGKDGEGRGYQPKITGAAPVLHPPTGVGNVQPPAAPAAQTTTPSGTGKGAE